MDFGEALARLFVQAGRPTLRAAATRATVSAQRISDWRSGRHVPRDFATVEPLLVWLTTRAVAASAPDVLSIPQWRELWDRHVSEESEAEQKPITTTRPYAGLATLTASDSALYFGRDDLVATLVDTILAADAECSAADDRHRLRLVVVTGVSGSGKSSLLGAGLARDARLDTPRQAKVAPDGIRFEPVDDDEHDGAVIVIDQFENIFSLDEDALLSTMREVEEFARETVVVLGVRADFFGQCVEFPFLADAWQSRCVIVPEMTRAQLREVITAPVRLAGGRIEAGLADVMITDLYEASTVVDRAGRLPLLAHVLHATWARRSGNRMTLSGYRATGGIARAVADTAESAWAAVDPADHDLARALLLALVHVGPAGIALRVPLAPATIAGRFPSDVSGVIEIFAHARLLTVSSDSVMLVHDVVLTSWPRLAEWIAADSGTHLWRQQLDSDTASWVASDRARSFLYTGSRLEDAREHRAALQRNYEHLLTKENEQFLDAAVAQQRRGRTVRLLAAALVALLAVASTITAAIVLRQAQDLTQQRNNAERAALLSHIDSMQQTNPSLAARLLLVAHGLYPDDPTVTNRVRGAATSPLATPMTGHSGPVYDLGFDRSGRLLASASGDRTVRLWERTADTTYRPLSELTGYGNYVTSVSFHPTRPLLATGSGDGTVRFWDVTTPAVPRLATTVSPGHGTVYLVRFSPDGANLAASSDDGTITIFGVPNDGQPAQTAVLDGHSAAARTVAYSPDGQLLATGGDDQVVRLWTTGDQPRPAGPPITGFPSITHALSFSPDSEILAVTGDSPNAQLWNVSNPARTTPVSTALPDATAGSWSIGFDSAGNRLASARADGTITVWNTINPTSPITQWLLQTASEQGSVRTFSAQFSPDGTRLVSGRSDGTIDVWSLPSSVLPDRGGTITGLGRSADNRVLVTVGTDTTLNVWTNDDDRLSQRSRTPIQRRVNDHPRVSVNAAGTQAATANNNGGVVELWRIADPESPTLATRLPIDTRYSFSVAFAPQGNVLATGGTDRTVALWNTDDPQRPRPLRAPLTGPSDLIRSIAFSPDGTRLAVTSDDKRIYLYDLTSPSSEPTAVIEQAAPATQTVFAEGGDLLVVASRDLTTWRLDDPGDPVLADRRPDIYAATLSLAPNRLVVGTSTHEMTSFAIDEGGALVDPQGVTPLLSTTDTTTTWQFPSQLPSDTTVITGGDITGSVYLQPLEVADARRWICRSTPPITSDQRESYLPHTDISAECD